MPTWDPEQYERFAVERARPFDDLVAQVPVVTPRFVIDLGCGPGTMTATLAERWPGATVLGADSSPEMIAAAQRLTVPGRLSFAEGDIRQWWPEADSLDVIVSNATLQWVPEHVDLFSRWVTGLRSGGVLAFQVPAPGTSWGALFREVTNAPRWAEQLAAVSSSGGPQGRSPVRTPGEYVEALAGLGLRVNVWETTYQHVLTGPDPVLEWFSGTGLRPYLDALAGDGAALAEFRAEVAERLREAYPERPYGTILPFRRIFAVGQRPPLR